MRVRIFLASVMVCNVTVVGQTNLETVEIASFRGRPAQTVWSQQHVVGLGQGGPQMEDFARIQNTPVWCWAACVQMLVDYTAQQPIVSQAAIVTRNYGAPIMAGAQTIEQIAANLDLWIPRRTGRDVRLSGHSFARPLDGDELREELLAKRPVILGVNASSHVVVCFGAKLRANSGGYDIEAIHIFDPLPGTGDQWLTRSQWPNHSRYRWESSVSFEIDETEYVSHPGQVASAVEVRNANLVPLFGARRMNFDARCSIEKPPVALVIRTFLLDFLGRPVSWVEQELAWPEGLERNLWHSFAADIFIPPPEVTWTMLVALRFDEETSPE